MQAWACATDVFEVARGARRFLNPLSEGPPPPFPAYLSEPVGHRVAAPSPYADTATDGELDPDDPVAKLVGRPTAARDGVPEFAVYGGRSLVRVLAARGTDRYGLGETCGPLRHENRKIVGWTSDTFAYDERAENLYQAHPWVLCVRPDGSAFGVIIETTWRFTAHLFDHLLVEVEGPPPAVTVIEGAHPSEVLTTLATLTGRIELPPRWALGFHQSKWNYAPADNVLEVARTFRERRLPADVIWVDIDYMDAYKVFTFDPDFGDVTKLNDALHELGWKAAWMIDPGIKIEPGYHVYDEAVAGEHLLEFEGVVWPGPTVFPDFTRKATREWWAGLYRDFLATGVDAVWNDMNEPSNLEDVPDKALPADVHHRADDELGGPGPHARYRNIYGLQMTRASHAGIRSARPDVRPFLLTRSTFLGGHRYAATWTGDNTSTWEHLHWSIPMTLNLGLSGQPLAGPDIGGFAESCTGPLLARWMGIGCLLPFARNHNMKTMPDQEPWVFGEAVEATCRRALERRYRLLPYLYTVAREAATTGLPIVRPAYFADPADPDLRAVDTAFLLGNDLYVRCDVTPTRSGPTAPVPTGWRRIHVLDPADDRDPDLPELYLRPGAVVPLGPVIQHADERPLDELTLVAHRGPDGMAVGHLYEDAGEGYGYLAGEYRVTEFRVHADHWDQAVIEGRWGPDAERPVTIQRVKGSW